jgi:hypothetical protein
LVPQCLVGVFHAVLFGGLLNLIADDVIWSTENGEIIRGKQTPELLCILQSLIKREVSLEVEIDRIVRISPCGYPELALDKYGHCGTPTTLQVVQCKVAMEILGLVKSSTTLSNALANDPFSNLRYPYLILAHDRYTLRNIEVKFVLPFIFYVMVIMIKHKNSICVILILICKAKNCCRGTSLSKESGQFFGNGSRHLGIFVGACAIHSHQLRFNLHNLPLTSFFDAFLASVR